MHSFHTYMLLCADGSYYIGHTDNLEYRISQHQNGTFIGYTSMRRPVTLIWSQCFQTREAAFKVERKIKVWTKAKKAALAEGKWDVISMLCSRKKKE